MAVKSPCIAVCALTSEGVCRGCGRTGQEIGQYRAASETERQAINDRARERLEQLAEKAG